nr:hypothetical protein [Tanacetum cinerariifolium]
MFGHLKKRLLARKKFNVLAQHLQEVVEEVLPKMVDDRVKELTKTQVPLYNLRAEITLQINNAITNHIPSRVDLSVRTYMSAENSAKRQKTSEHGTYVFRESSSGQDNESEPGPSTSGNQEQLDDFDFFTDSYATDDNELPTEKVSQELVEEMSQTIDKAKLRNFFDEMLRQRYTSGDKHQYHIDQMQNFLKDDIVWESKKDILSLPFPQKPTLVIQSCQRYPNAPALSLVNQYMLYLKKGNSRPEKIMLSLHKFSTVIFLNDDIEERTSRWVDKCMKNFNPYARYSVEHWKNPHAKIFYIKRQKEPGNPKEEVYSNSKIVQVIKTYGELGHEHKSIMIWERVHDFQLGMESYQYKVNLTASTITFSGIKKHKMLSIVFELVYGIIYKNGKKEKSVTRHQETHRFCDATLKKVLEGLKSYNNNVKQGYVTPSISKEDDEYLQLSKEEIEETLKHRDKMRRWEMYVNERLLGSRRSGK